MSLTSFVFTRIVVIDAELYFLFLMLTISDLELRLMYPTVKAGINHTTENPFEDHLIFGFVFDVCVEHRVTSFIEMVVLEGIEPPTKFL